MKFFNRTGENLNRKKIKIISQTPEEIIADIERYDNPTNEGTKIDAETFNQFQHEIDTANTNANAAVNTANNANDKSDNAVTTANSAKSIAEGADTKSNTAISTSNTASNNASTAVNTANTALSNSQQAVSTANTASQNATTAVSTANEAKDVAENAETKSTSADSKSTTALNNSNTALSTANTALSNSQQAITDSLYAKNKANEVESKLADRGATIKVGSNTVTEVNFSSDPQTQLNNQNTEIINIKNNITNIANNSGGFSCGSGATNGSGLQFKGFTLCDANGKIPVARLVDAIYPIGSIYMSTGSTSPASLFGGTWEQLKDRFLLGGGGSYALGGTGGASTHTLTTNEMPSHRHGLSSTHAGSWCDDYDWVKPLGNYGGGGANKSGAVAEMCINTGMGQRYVESYDAAYSGHIMEAMGGDSAHNNMPPYLVVNMWKRVS